MAGKIFEGRVDGGEVEELKRRRHVTQSILVEGRHRVRIFEPSGQAPVGFEPAIPSLEDAYFVLMRREPAAAADAADEPATELAEAAAGGEA